MIHEAEALVEQLKRLVASAPQVGEDTGMREKRAQLQVLGKTLTELQCQGLPVPVDIERIVAGLRADLDGAAGHIRYVRLMGGSQGEARPDHAVAIAGLWTLIEDMQRHVGEGA